MRIPEFGATDACGNPIIGMRDIRIDETVDLKDPKTTIRTSDVPPVIQQPKEE